MPGSGRAATCRSRPRRRTTAFGRRRSPPAGSSAPATRSRRFPPERLRPAALRLPFGVARSIRAPATVQPARLALGLRERLRARGVEVYERSPVSSARRAAPAASRRGPPAAWCGLAPRSSRSAAPRSRRAGRCGTGSRSPPPTSSSPSRCPMSGGDRLDRWRVHHRQPRPDRLLPHHARRPDRLRLGRWPDRDGRAPVRPLRDRPRGRCRVAAHLCDYFPGLAGPRAHPRLGRPDRRLPHPPARRPAAARRPRLRRRRLHRQWRRPLPHGRPNPRLPSPRPPRRALPPRLRRSLAAPRPTRALPLARRRSNPSRNHRARRTPS